MYVILTAGVVGKSKEFMTRLVKRSASFTTYSTEVRCLPKQEYKQNSTTVNFMSLAEHVLPAFLHHNIMNFSSLITSRCQITLKHSVDLHIEKLQNMK